METHEYTSSCAITHTHKKNKTKREMLMSECQKENITVHSQSKNPVGEDTVSAGGDVQAATLEACPVHSQLAS